MMESLLPAYELSILQRMLLIWLFIALGLVLAFHAAQHYAEEPYSWTRLTEKTIPYWYTFYVLEAFLLVQISYRVFLFNMSGNPLLFGYEEQVLNSIWMGLLGLEAIMVVSVAAMTVFRAVAPARPQQKVAEKEL